MESDAWDAEAVHIVVWDGAELAGTVRLVPPAPGRRLPVEEVFELTIEPQGEVVDGGRLVVALAHRTGGAHKVLALLFARFWLEANGRGFRRIAAAAPPALVALYRRLGLDVQVLGPPRRHWGEKRSPLLIGASTSSFAALRASPAPVRRVAR